jgi:hypothetical protein
LRIHDLTGLKHREIIEIPIFSDLHYLSMSRLYHNFRKKKEKEKINIFTFSQSVPFYWILPRMSYAAVIRPNFPSAITETGVAEQDVFRAGVNIIGPGVAGTDAKMDVVFLAQDHLATCEQPVAWEFQGQPGAPGGAAIDGPGRSDRQSDCDRRPRLAVVRRTKAKGTDCENVNLFAIMEI